MSQHDYNLANGSGLSIRTDLNAVLSAIVTQNSGVSEPTPTYPLQWWADTLTGYLKQRNSANDAWLIKWDLSKGQLATLYSPTFGGLVNLPATTYINGNAVATLVAPNFSGISVFEKLTAWSDVSLPASTTIGGVSATELSYLDGVTSSIQSQLNALSTNKQATLVSGTNIKTVNGNSLVGSGNISITPNPSVVFANSQTFTASGTFTVPVGVTTLMIKMAHAGAGGGAGSRYGWGGGGSASIFGSPIILTVTPGQIFSVTIGAGGAGGAGTTNTTGLNGGAGGNTFFGNYCAVGSQAVGLAGLATSQWSGGSGAGVISGKSTAQTANASGGYSGSDGSAGVYTQATGAQLNSVGIGGISDANNGGNGGSAVGAVGGAGGTGGAGKVIVYW